MSGFGVYYYHFTKQQGRLPILLFKHAFTGQSGSPSLVISVHTKKTFAREQTQP